MNWLKQMFDWVFAEEQRIIVLFWLSSLVLYPLYSFSYQPIWESFIHKLGFLPVQIMAAYLLLRYFLPNLLYRRRYLLFLLAVTVTGFVLAFIMNIIDIYLVYPYLYDQKVEGGFSSLMTAIHERWFWYLTWIFVAPMLLLGVLLLKRSYEERQTLQLLLQEKADAELNMLKSQIHPEFISNTLRNLEGLANQKSDQAPVVVEKLADILDHMLYRSESARVPLSQELELLENYLYLEQLRLGASTEWSLQKPVVQQQVFIAPLLLVSLVEELLTKLYGASPIDLSVLIELRGSILSCEVQRQQVEADLSTVGISTSLRRQLELSYSGAYELIPKLENNQYSLALSIEL